MGNSSWEVPTLAKWMAKQRDKRGSILLTSVAPSRAPTATIYNKSFEIQCYFRSLPTMSAYSSHRDPFFTTLVMCGQQKTTEFSMPLRTWKIRFRRLAGVESAQGSSPTDARAQGSTGPRVDRSKRSERPKTGLCSSSCWPSLGLLLRLPTPLLLHASHHNCYQTHAFPLVPPVNLTVRRMSLK